MKSKMAQKCKIQTPGAPLDFGESRMTLPLVLQKARKFYGILWKIATFWQARIDVSSNPSLYAMYLILKNQSISMDLRNRAFNELPAESNINKCEFAEVLNSWPKVNKTVTAAKKKKKPKCKGTKSSPVGSPKQKAFCKRHCGHKKKNTGKEKQKDPDSCINRGLRRWKCRCASSLNTLLHKLADDYSDVYGVSPVDAFDIIRNFKELYENLRLGDTEKSLEIMKELKESNNLDNFPEYAEAKSGQLLEADKIEEDEIQEDLDDIQQRFEEIKDQITIKNKKPSFKALASLGLSNPVENKLQSSLNNFEEGNNKEGIMELIRAREIMFPEVGEAAINPENMTFDAIDFFSDEGMWRWIAESKDKEILEEDAVNVLKESLEDLLSRSIFGEDSLEDLEDLENEDK